jgi:hypothetical protein
MSVNTQATPASEDVRELNAEEIAAVSGGMNAIMYWGSNLMSVSSEASGGSVMVSNNNGKSGSYSTF